MTGARVPARSDRDESQIGAPYLMTGSEVLAHIAMGHVPHLDAPEDRCGATDPRDPKRWCIRDENHPGDHCSDRWLREHCPEEFR